MQGATAAVLDSERQIDISTPAPHIGCDLLPAQGPAGNIFQITHPMRGATVQDKQLAVIWAISIHAPCEGCDISLILANLSQSDFNSRTP